MEEYEFLVNGKVIASKKCLNDDEAIDYATSLSIALNDPRKIVDWRKVYGKKENK